MLTAKQLDRLLTAMLCPVCILVCLYAKPETMV